MWCNFICIISMRTLKFAANLSQANIMKTFSEILSTLDSAEHVKSIILFNPDNSIAGMIENKPGSQGSIKMYHYLYKKWGSINVEAAREGLSLYAEHTADAQNFPGKHPNIDRLLMVIAQNTPLSVEIASL